MKKTYALLTAAIAVSACSPAPDASANREASGKIEPAKIIRAAAPVKPVKLVKTKQRVNLDKREFDCLARNVYHEAGVESKAGKIAVAQVTINRVKSKKWGRNVCDAVYSKAQFSWTLQKAKRWVQPKGKLWEETIQAVHEFADGVRVAQVQDSLFYHTDYIKTPNWADATKVTARVGQHIFYADAKKS